MNSAAQARRPRSQLTVAQCTLEVCRSAPSPAAASEHRTSKDHTVGPKLAVNSHSHHPRVSGTTPQVGPRPDAPLRTTQPELPRG